MPQYGVLQQCVVREDAVGHGLVGGPGAENGASDGTSRADAHDEQPRASVNDAIRTPVTLALH
ncbi:hypothetical protein AAW14_24860 [Streptomyces hygroscopicus]|nr:hypothetical protein [Streptomyces hygroscopicus]